MKILHVISTYKPAYIYGGPIMSISKLCESLAKKPGVEIRLITTDANGEERLHVKYNEVTNVDGLEVIYFKRISGDPHEVSPLLWRYIIKHCKEYDVIHLHAWWNLLVVVAAVICNRNGVKVIISPRGMLSNYIFTARNSIQKSFLHKLIGKKTLKKTFFHATSNQEFMECKNLITGWNGFLIPNILELPKIEIVKRKNDVFTMGFLSRIDPKKGLEFIFEALAKISFPAKLRIAGRGEESYIKQLKLLAQDLQISEKIEWLGWLNPQEKFNELMHLDLFVLTSYNENFANVVIEALHVGTPVCISRHVGLSDFIQQENLGWVTELNIEDISKAISDAYYNIGKRRNIEKIASEEIEKNFSNDILIASYMDMYKKVIDWN